MIGALAITLGACSSKNYTIKTEKKENLNTVPAWYMADIDEQDACDLKWFDKSDMMTDYFHIAYYCYIDVGRSKAKPYICTKKALLV